MAAKKETVHPDKIPYLDKLIESVPGLERKGDTMPYTSLNGHMFSYIDKDGTYALRLPEDVRAEFLKKYKSKLHEAYGIIQKEYVDVPEKLFKNTKELKEYFVQSYEYVNSLKPKPTKKAKPAKK